MLQKFFCYPTLNSTIYKPNQNIPLTVASNTGFMFDDFENIIIKPAGVTGLFCIVPPHIQVGTNWCSSATLFIKDSNSEIEYLSTLPYHTFLFNSQELRIRFTINHLYKDDTNFVTIKTMSFGGIFPLN
jgi:hypothetical protein